MTVAVDGNDNHRYGILEASPSNMETVNGHAFLPLIPKPGMWTSVASMDVAPADHTATRLPDGKVLMVGGYNPGEGYLNMVLMYDPEQ